MKRKRGLGVKRQMHRHRTLYNLEWRERESKTFLPLLGSNLQLTTSIVRKNHPQLFPQLKVEFVCFRLSLLGQDLRTSLLVSVTTKLQCHSCM